MTSETETPISEREPRKTARLLDAIATAKGGFIQLHEIVGQEILWRYGEEQPFIDAGLISLIVDDGRAYLSLTFAGHRLWQKFQVEETKSEEEQAPDLTLAMDNEPIHTWFNLSYASYLILPRSVLQSMPIAWQRRFVACVEQLMEAANGLDMPDYQVRAFNSEGKFTSDDLRDYERGRRRVALKETEAEWAPSLRKLFDQTPMQALDEMQNLNAGIMRQVANSGSKPHFAAIYVWGHSECKEILAEVNRISEGWSK